MTSRLAKLDINWYCGGWTSDGRFSESQMLSVNRKVTKKIYSAKFLAARYHVNALRQTYCQLGRSRVHFREQRIVAYDVKG